MDVKEFELYLKHFPNGRYRPLAELKINRLQQMDNNKTVLTTEVIDGLKLFIEQRLLVTDGASITATQVYEEYIDWCEERTQEPLSLPEFGRDFSALGIQKAKIAGRVRYIGIQARTKFPA